MGARNAQAKQTGDLPAEILQQLVQLPGRTRVLALPQRGCPAWLCQPPTAAGEQAPPPPKPVSVDRRFCMQNPIVKARVEGSSQTMHIVVKLT